ncbi:TonB-dependent receptor [Dasania marina]|uniref:TonB-dependent receptor n=1 Tax=Dasania marina TaxID=471499 RepID=UPI0004770950|nr:TonB-dependent receptor [Dasania marina]
MKSKYYKNKFPYGRMMSLTLASVNVLMAGVASPTYAAGMEELIVTASRRAEMVMDIPYNITAVSGDSIEAAQITDATDLMRSMTGVNVVDRGYRNSGAINGIMIRGMNVDGGGNGDIPLSAVPTVSTYINDSPLYANFILKDIERVEVLRGPQGTLYGSGALAGTVRYIMKQPETEEFYGKASGSYSQTEGSEGFSWSSDLVLNMPINDQIAVRLSGGMIDADGITDYTNVYALDEKGAPIATGGDITNGDPIYTEKEDADTVEIWHGKASILFQPSDEFKALLTYQQQSDEIGGRRQQTTGTHWVTGVEQAYDDYENGSIQLEPSSRDVDMTMLEMEYDMGFATLVSSTSAYEHTGESISENTGFYAKFAWFTTLYGGTPRPIAKSERSYSDEAVIQEFRLVSNTDGFVDWTAGLYYMDQEMGAVQTNSMPGWSDYINTVPSWYGHFFGADTSTEIDFAYDRKTDFEDKAVFGELTFNISDEFRATLGARYFDNKFVNKTTMDTPIWSNPATPEFEISDDGVLLKGNVSWDFGPSQLAYITVSEGYRRGGANAVPLTGGFAEDPAWQQYDSDSVINYEVGFKGSPGLMKYNVSLFYMDWDDAQLNTATPIWGFYAAINAGKARSQGVEVEIEGMLTDDLHYTVGYAYVDSELREDVFSPTGGAIAEKGEQLPGTARNILSASADYSQLLDSGINWTSRLHVYYQSASRNSIGSDPRFDIDFDGFQLWNASTQLIADSWTATLFAKNLTNEEGVTGTLSEGYMGTEPSQNFLGNSSKDYIVLPRTLGVALTYSF